MTFITIMQIFVMRITQKNSQIPLFSPPLAATDADTQHHDNLSAVVCGTPASLR
ncbi:hypothetical protein [Candidatus Sodalis pierantonius]|uniref:hypothetical protein n=1 Tax=Candidatus Sodalis pierantonii TaxID=1486991 RepID=UPI00130EF93B|nr:hypothetical protein [Candidatus Sodalis pierantonius]